MQLPAIPGQALGLQYPPKGGGILDLSLQHPCGMEADVILPPNQFLSSCLRGEGKKTTVLPPPATTVTQGTSAKQDKQSVTAQEQSLSRKLHSAIGQQHKPMVTHRTDMHQQSVPYWGTHISVPPLAQSCRPCRAQRCPAGICPSPPRSQGSCSKHSAAASSMWPAPLCRLL